MRRAVCSGRLVVAAVVLGAGLVAPAAGQASVDHIVVAVPNHSPGVGTTFTVRAYAKNAAGQTDKGFNGPAFWSDRSGQLSPDAPSDFVDGVSTTTDASVAVPFHSDSIIVLSGGLSGRSGAINVIGPLDHFSFTPQLHKEAVNTSFTVTVYARDAAGNLISDYGGSPSWSDGSGSLSPSSPAAFSGGVSTNTNTQIADPSHQDKITVTDASAGVQSSTHAFNVLGPFDHFTFSQLSAVAKNQPFKLVLRAVDSAGNIVTGYGGSPSWSDGSLTVSPIRPAPFVNGVSVNRCTRVGALAPGDQITVDDASAGVSSTSPAFDVTAAQVFSTPGTYPVTVQCDTSLTVTVIGAHGGGVSGCNGTASGGQGASVTGRLVVFAVAQLTAGVGGVGGASSAPGCLRGAGGTGSGANGGRGGAGSGGGGGGGAASFLSTGAGLPTASSLLLVAGGGGGAAPASLGSAAPGGNADSAGSPLAGHCGGEGCGGGAGTSPGGTGGASDGNPGDTNGSNGGFLFGGAGGNSGAGATTGSGGGGGGGYYGGGGGGAGGENGGSGGGGQSFITSSAGNTTGPTPTSNPAEVSITYAPLVG